MIEALIEAAGKAAENSSATQNEGTGGKNETSPSRNEGTGGGNDALMRTDGESQLRVPTPDEIAEGQTIEDRSGWKTPTPDEISEGKNTDDAHDWKTPTPPGFPEDGIGEASKAENKSDGVEQPQKPDILNKSPELNLSDSKGDNYASGETNNSFENQPTRGSDAGNPQDANDVADRQTDADKGKDAKEAPSKQTDLGNGQDTQNEQKGQTGNDVSDNDKKYTDIPRNDGMWEGEPGNSKWKPDRETIPKKYNPEDKTWGQILDENGIDGIDFVDGEPDFSEIAEETVEIDEYSQDRDDNYDSADEKLAEKWTKEQKDGHSWSADDVAQYRKEHQLSWHEKSDMKTMQLVPREVHLNIPHKGGISAANSTGD